jgi:hypothetical protein
MDAERPGSQVKVASGQAQALRDPERREQTRCGNRAELVAQGTEECVTPGAGQVHRLGRPRRARQVVVEIEDVAQKLGHVRQGDYLRVSRLPDGLLDLDWKAA